MNKTDNTHKNKLIARAAIMIAAFVTALAIAISATFLGGEKPITADNVSPEVSTSATNHGALSGDGFISKVNAGQVANGDYLSYSHNGTSSTSGSYVSLNLPRGTYKFEVWGARGGGCGNDNGGMGGHAWGEITITSTLTYYIYCGGVGTNSTSSIDGNNDSTHYSGGWNGGGSGSGSAGPGGGGGTDIRYGGTSTSNRIIVAGGGGGGVNQANSSVHNATTSTGRSTAVLYSGENGCSNRHSSSYSNDEGGGGGGYYGGAINHSDDAKCGYAGSNYVNTSYFTDTTKNGNEYSSNTGVGRAQITVVSINQIPTTKNYSVNIGERRADYTQRTISVDNIAQDPDAVKTTLAFTNGTAGSYDSFTNTANTNLFLNDACTVSANKYFEWTWATVSNVTRSFNITRIKNYPRAGNTGCTSDGTVKLYARVRDSFGTSASRGVAVIPFSVTVNKNSVALPSKISASMVLGSTTTTHDCLVGNSVANAAAPEYPESATQIYNPSGGGVPTIFIKQTLKLNSTITITASSLLSGLSITSGQDMAVFSIPDLTSITGSSRKFKVAQVESNTNKVTVYNNSLAQISNTYDRIGLQIVTPTPGYHVLPIKIHLIEKAACNGTNVELADSGNVTPKTIQIVFKMENTRPVLKNGVSNVVDLAVGATQDYSLDTYFSDVDESSITASTHSIDNVIVPTHEFIMLDKLQNTVTPAAPNASYYNVGTKASDAFTTSAMTTTETHFDPLIAYNQKTGGTDTSRTAFMRYTYSGITLTVTGLRASFSQYYSTRSNAPGHFYLLIHVIDARDRNDQGIWLPLAFKIGGSTATHKPVDTVTAPHSVTSQTALTVLPTASGSVGEQYVFTPMAINYNGSHVIGKYKGGNGTLTQDRLIPLAIDGDNYATETGRKGWGGTYLNEFLTFTSTVTPENIVKNMSEAGAQETGDGGWENRFVKVYNEPIYIEKSYFPTAEYSGGRIVAGTVSAPADAGFKAISLANATDNNDYYTINGFRIVFKSSTLNRYLYTTCEVQDTSGQKAQNITIAVRVNNTSPYAYTSAQNKVAVYGNSVISDEYSTYAYDPDNEDVSKRVTTPVFNYKIPLGASFIFTPYDLAFDNDFTAAKIAGVDNFTLNGFDGRYNSSNGKYTVGSTNEADGSEVNGVFDKSVYDTTPYQNSLAALLNAINTPTPVKLISNTASGTSPSAAKTANGNVPQDRLFFLRNSAGTDSYTYAPTTYGNFAVAGTNLASGAVTASYGSTVSLSGKDYALDFVLIKANTRTAQGQPVVLEMQICDKSGNWQDGSHSFLFKVEIEVVNTRPNIKNPAYYEELAVTPVDLENGKVLKNSFVFSANGTNNNGGLMDDHDGDTPEFIMSRGTLIANTPDLITTMGRKDNMIDSFADPRITSDYTEYKGVPLSSYVSAVLSGRQALTVTAHNSTKAIPSGLFVYFFVSDGNGGISLGYVRVEVVNTLPVLNTDDNTGFALSDPMWQISSTSDSDISASRYIVASQAMFEAVKNIPNTDPANVKLIATDADELQNSLVLSQVTTVNDVRTSINLSSDTSTPLADRLQAAVPNVDDAYDFNGAPLAVAIYTFDLTENIKIPGAPSDNFLSELIFLTDKDNGVWKTRAQLIAELTANPDEVNNYFDGEGRWIATDWALHLKATSGFDPDKRMEVLFSLRDEAALGGDTADRPTAYHSDRNHTNDVGALDNRMTVNGRLETAIRFHISKTGIRSINEYLNKNDNLYLVEYTDDKNVSTKYVSTYDGDTNSLYAATQPTLYSSGGKLASSGDLIKERAQNTPDKTKAGTNSGSVYVPKTEYEGAFTYTDVINVPATTIGGMADDAEHPKYKTVYVPMSYFGLLSTLATPVADGSAGKPVGSVNYFDDYVGYDVAGADVINRSNFESVAPAISLSDGVTSWPGAEIANNPYITIDTFYYDVKSGQSSENLFADPDSKPYYNNRLAIPTVNDKGELLAFNSSTYNSFVGDGKLMYLEDQANSLIEHNFGLKFTKKNMRTGVSNLTLTIKLAKSNDGKINAASANDRCTVTVKIHVDNTPFDFDTGTDNSLIKYDEEAGTYYVDIGTDDNTFTSSQSRSFALTRRSRASGLVEGYSPNYGTNIGKIPYNDDDYESSQYRDYVTFLSDSFDRLSDWYIGENAYKRVTELNGGKFANASSSDRAQNSLARYFRLPKTDYSGAADITNTFVPNGGFYGTGSGSANKEVGREGYSRYFNVSTVDEGRIINFTAIAKTDINGSVLSSLAGENPTQESVKSIYLERGLIAEYDTAETDPLTPSRVYYPLRVLVYDSCGAGWNVASYLAIEFRVEIINGAPTLKEVGQSDGAGGRTYTLDLAVSNSMTINLYDFVRDSDILTMGSGGIYSLATEKQFVTGAGDFASETGDYLDSPLAHDPYKNTPYNPSAMPYTVDGKEYYYYSGGGFTEYKSDEWNSRDVVMWMETEENAGGEKVPTANYITFNVNRRTTAEYQGKYVSINQYRFTLSFYDSTGTAHTEPITFIINISNQAPTIIATDREFTMRANDELTVLTSYYDVFTGATGSKSKAFSTSQTKTYLTGRENADGYGVNHGDGTNVDTPGSFWLYRDITKANEESKVIHDSTTAARQNENVHLGYFALADDDTPWRLRITDVQYGDNLSNKLHVDQAAHLSLRNESGEGTGQIAVRIRALGALVKEPITFVIDDGESGGKTTVTLYITVISSKPVALDYNDPNDRTEIERCGLEGVENTNDQGYAQGVFRLFTVASSNPVQVNMTGFDAPRTAKKQYSVRMTNVATDPDGAHETENMGLYGSGDFAVNGTSLVRGDDGVYSSEYFDVEVRDGGREILITATGYNANGGDYETLTFRIGDYGNDVYENSIEITIRVYTMYSDITNPVAAQMTDAQFTEYIKGADAVNVKAFEKYYDSTVQAKPSRYAFVAASNNVGNDNNDLSPIVDPDVSKIDDQGYVAKLYALFDVDDNGKIVPIAEQTLKGMFERNATAKTFKLRDADFTEYLIGGIDINGNAIAPTQSNETAKRYSAVTHYADFEFDSNRAAVLFTPNSSTLDNRNVLLYVEVEKPFSERTVKRTDAVLNAGALFRLNVENSAPFEISGIREVQAHKGESGSFKIFDSEDGYDALFNDYDSDDFVTVFGLTDGKLNDSEYDFVMSAALQTYPNLDWAASGSKPRAFDISVDAENNLIVTVNRRIDYAVDGVYSPAVTIPLLIKCVDSMNRTSHTQINLTVLNTDVDSLPVYSDYDENTGVGYTFEKRDSGYEMRVNLKYDKTNQTTFTVELDSFMRDADIIKGADTDSYRFVDTVGEQNSIVGNRSVLTNSEVEVKAYGKRQDGSIDLDKYVSVASATPVGDSLHRTGITFRALTTVRNLEATLFVRIIDRSGNDAAVDGGLLVKITVIVMNDAPQVLENKHSTVLHMMGSQKSTPSGMLFFLGDFVTDINDSDVLGDKLSSQNRNTYLRMFRQESYPIEAIYSSLFTGFAAGTDNGDILSSALFTVTTPATLDDKLLEDYRVRNNISPEDFDKDNTNMYNQWFVVTPRQGYYGHGTVDITVSDGDTNVMSDTRTATFRIEVHVVVNPDEVVSDMNAITIACGKTKQFGIHSLMPDMKNTLVFDNKYDNPQPVQPSADGDTFNQYDYYELVGIDFQNSADNGKASFKRIEGTEFWEIKANNQVTLDPVRIEARFALKTNPDKVYRRYLYLNIIANQPPKLNYSEISFVRHKDDASEVDPLRDLDSSNTIRLEAWQLFNDADDPDGSSIRIIDATSKVNSLVRVSVEKDEMGNNRYLVINFVGRGESEITVRVTDETGVPVSLSFVAKNTDLPEASMWVRISASFERNMLLWVILICCFVLLFIVLIIIFTVIKKRRTAREELEALLVSEMEIEEQMLKLAGGPNPTDYRSFGYLPPTQTPNDDPSLMLGTGGASGDTPPADPQNALPPPPEAGTEPPPEE